MEQNIVAGPAGAIETRTTTPSDPGGALALLCHPHPLYGGSMDDMVVSHIENGLLSQGVTTVKFNFRGVGASEGVHDKGIGEVEDLVFLADFLRVEGNITQFMLCGYSFGAVVALDALPRTSVDFAILVAPPVAMLGPADLPRPDKPALVILGERDDIVDAGVTGAWFQDASFQDASFQDKPDANRCSVELLTGADHFFAGFGKRIESLAGSFVASQLASPQTAGG